jgi:2-polyprenyl-3-methyl-5-hydroxy-6-metoxy-1,4-benzoquinol methylase
VSYPITTMSDNRSHIQILPKKPRITIGRLDYVIEYCSGRNILHLGCVDQGVTQDKFNQGILLHERIYQVANSLWGVDNDENGIEWMKGKGYPNLFMANIENLHSIPELFQQSFDVILLTEVLEHLNNPGFFLASIYELFEPHTTMLITVPNSTSLANLVYSFMRKELVHPDHNYWFSYSTLKHILEKNGYEILSMAVYTQFDYRKSLLTHLEKRFGQILGLNGTSHVSTATSRSSPLTNSNGKHKLRILGWIKVVIMTFLYRFFLDRNPFFADGLISITRPKGNE